jgi:predicted ATPase
MITETEITIKSFKSLENVNIKLGIINVFVGANGSGKSNLLEAIGILSAAADGKVTDQTLMQRGVRPGVPKLYKSSFLTKNIATHISFRGESKDAFYDVSLHNPLNDPSPAWNFKTESLKCTGSKDALASRSQRSKNQPTNTENGLAALKIVELKKDNPALILMRHLQSYVIYSPTTPVLRGIAPETQPRQPLGLSGGRLPEAVQELLKSKVDSMQTQKICKEALNLISWAKSYGTRPASHLPLSPAASSSPNVIRFVDKYMKENRNVLSGYDASEGALFVLFLAVLAGHPKSPSFFAVDNADHGLNPGLATELMKHFSDWVLSSENPSQILITSHNPAVLDGLPLLDDRVRLFTVDRDNKGKTIIKRVVVDEKLLAMSAKGWTLSRLWMNKFIGGMPNV